MPCLKRLNGFRSRIVNANTGKRSIVFSPREGFSDFRLSLPCGQCRFCRLEHSRQWAMRCVHEASLYPTNCFLTLTYDDDHLPQGGSLNYDHPVTFMRDLRAHLDYHFQTKIRSFGCAEYGELLSRPHYHLCLFNFDFPDKYLFKRSSTFPLFRSKLLESLWPHGHSSIGTLNFETAAYVARYVTKKITGPPAQKHYDYINPVSGEVFTRLPERPICVSRMPGIGRLWYEKYGDFTRTHDFAVLRGKKMRPPKYYDRLFDLADPQLFAKVKSSRKKAGEASEAVLQSENAEALQLWAAKGGFVSGDQMPTDRLSVIEKFTELKFQQLKRGFENG